MANVDLRNLRYDSAAGYGNPNTELYVRYDSGGITRGRHARRLRYTTMSGRMDVMVAVCVQCVVDDYLGVHRRVIRQR